MSVPLTPILPRLAKAASLASALFALQGCGLAERLCEWPEKETAAAPASHVEGVRIDKSAIQTVASTCESRVERVDPVEQLIVKPVAAVGTVAYEVGAAGLNIVTLPIQYLPEIAHFTLGLAASPFYLVFGGEIPSDLFVKDAPATSSGTTDCDASRNWEGAQG